MSAASDPVIVVGSGPAGLMAADVVASAGRRVVVVEAMPSPARKLLMAGRGGLNLTHSEPLEAFLGRYGPARAALEAPIRRFPPDALRAFVEALGQPTFVGSSGRIFPRAMKASPLLRAWLKRLGELGVEIRTRQRWLGFDRDGQPLIRGAAGGTRPEPAAAVVLALGGASWPRLGSDGSWVEILAGLGVAVTHLAPANAGVSVDWSEHLRARFAGEPLKRIAVTVAGTTLRGEAVLTKTGLEGGVIYALNPILRDLLRRDGRATLTLDLRPDLDAEALTARLDRPRAKQSLASYLRKAAYLSPAGIALLREAAAGSSIPELPGALARAIKQVPVVVTGLSGLGRAISSAGGIALAEIDDWMMLKRRPGVFVAGEMLDWEAPTGGYLLQVCFSTGHLAGEGVLRWLSASKSTAEPDADAASLAGAR